MKSSRFIAPNVWTSPTNNPIPRKSLISLVQSNTPLLGTLFPNETEFCNLLDSKREQENLDFKSASQIIPWKRIGSLSSEAEVYQIESPFYPQIKAGLENHAPS